MYDFSGIYKALVDRQTRVCMMRMRLQQLRKICILGKKIYYSQGWCSPQSYNGEKERLGYHAKQQICSCQSKITCAKEHKKNEKKRGIQLEQFFSHELAACFDEWQGKK